MRTELEKRAGSRDVFYGTFEKFGRKSGYKHEETTLILVDIEDKDGNHMTDHLWFNYTKQFRELYESGKLTTGAIIEFTGKSDIYAKGYYKDEFDYKLARPTKIKIIGMDPEIAKLGPCDSPLDTKLELEEIKKTGTLGTKEWADDNVNLQKGCPHGCLYCYAMKMAFRFKRAKDIEEWKIPVMQTDAIHNYRPSEKRFMYPSSHDITPENIGWSTNLISRMIGAGIRMLIVSKPHFDCIYQIIDWMEKWTETELTKPKKLLEFRFTIGSTKDEILSIWEPNAPQFQERLDCLKYAFYKGYQTSISIEPYLENPIEVIKAVLPFVTGTIWIGIMNTIHLTKIAWPIYNELKMAELYSKDFLFHNLVLWVKLAGGKLRLKDSVQHLTSFPQNPKLYYSCKVCHDDFPYPSLDKICQECYESNEHLKNNTFECNRCDRTRPNSECCDGGSRFGNQICDDCFEEIQREETDPLIKANPFIPRFLEKKEKNEPKIAQPKMKTLLSFIPGGSN